MCYGTKIQTFSPTKHTLNLHCNWAITLIEKASRRRLRPCTWADALLAQRARKLRDYASLQPSPEGRGAIIVWPAHWIHLHQEQYSYHMRQKIDDISHMQRGFKLKKIVNLKIFIQIKLRLHHYLCYDKIFKTRPHLLCLQDIFLKKLFFVILNHQFQLLGTIF